MNPIAIDGPAVEPISLAEMKAHLRLDGTDEDDLVGALIVAARLTVEGATRLALIEQTWRLTLGCWPAGRVVDCRPEPVLSVDALRLVGTTGASTVVDPGLYRLDARSDRPRLLVDGSVPDPGRRIEIDLVCGLGSGPAAVPEPLRLAVLRLGARWFERRGDADERSEALPSDVALLVAPYRRPRIA